MNIEQQLNAREARRLAAEDRFLARQERREAEAEALVGELCQNGVTVWYVNERYRTGRFTGRIVKFAGRSGAIAFLLRNNYV